MFTQYFNDHEFLKHLISNSYEMSEFNLRIFSCIHNDIHVMIYIFKQKCIHQQLQRQKLKSERAAGS